VDTRVGSFNGFDGNRRLVFHDRGLSHVQPPQFLCETPAERDVVHFRERWLPATDRPRGDQQFRNQVRRSCHFDPVMLVHPHGGHQQRVVAAILAPGDE
jgi:hypothetical protein